MNRVGGIDSTFEAFLSRLPRALREAGENLPYRVGLVPTPDATWEDVVVLEPNRDLPAFAAEDPERPSELLVSGEKLERFREAHHLGVVHGFLWCSLGRGRVKVDPHLVALRRALRRAWEEALAQATGGDLGRELARGCVAQTLAATRRGMALERRALARGILDAAAYTVMVREMTGWLGATAQHMVLWLAGRKRAQLLRQSYERLLLALRCLDDAFKGLEAQASGADVWPDRLPPGELLTAAPRVTRQASQTARIGGFHRLADWLDTFARTVDGMKPANVLGDEDFDLFAPTVGRGSA